MTAQQQVSGPPLGLRILALVGGVALLAGAIVLGNSSPASAEGLERFASCDALRLHLADAMEDQARDQVFEETGAALAGGDGDAATADRGGPAPASPLGADQEAAGRDGTNTQVEGVDELDQVDVLRDGRILVSRHDRVLLLSADGSRVLATLPVDMEPQITFDDARSTLWAISTDWQTTVLTRAVLEGDAFRDVATWQVAGGLVDLRRSGGEVHLVLVDEEFSVLPLPEPEPEPEPEPTTTTEPEPETTTTSEPEPETTTTTEPETETTVTAPQDEVEGQSAPGAVVLAQDDEDAALPFSGTSPVPCDEVLHPPLPGGPATTLVATFQADGELAPVAATEIVGAGDNVLVTASALYVSTPSYDGDQVVTGLHRFDLDGLRHTGSGSVPGRLLNQFSIDEHDGHLRAAVTVGDEFLGRPIAADGPAVGGAVEDAGDAAAVASDPAAALNEIVVLDLDGALDVIGRTPRFGKPGETLHGIRFRGDVAYAVTFLQTDPFYVVDLSRPTSPGVVGELEIPGFSAYLHPIGDGRVVGFGPDGEGRVAARLFDTSDPTAPRVVDTVAFAAESPIVYDHHALRVDGDRLVVAAVEYVLDPPSRCEAILPDDSARAAAEEQLNDLYLQIDALYQGVETIGEPADTGAVDAKARDLQLRVDELSECVYPDQFPQARIATLTPTGDSLAVSTIATEAGDAVRVIPLADGYLVVGSRITKVSPTGATHTTIG